MSKINLLFSVILLAFNLGAKESPAEKGLKLSRKIAAANSGVIGEDPDMAMVLIDAYNAKTIRKTF